MSEILPDDVQALRDALEASPGDVTVTLSLTRRRAVKVLELLEAEHATGAVVVPATNLFTSTEAASILGMSRPTLMKLVDAGVIEHVQIGTHRRIPMPAVVEYQRNRQREQEPSSAANQPRLPPTTKEDRMSKKSLITEIAALVGAPDPGPGVGSSVYKVLLTGVCERLGIDSVGTMPQLAQRIVTKADLPYLANLFDSRLTASGGGSTVTEEGLVQVRAAVVKMLGR